MKKNILIWFSLILLLSSCFSWWNNKDDKQNIQNNEISNVNINNADNSDNNISNDNRVKRSDAQSSQKDDILNEMKEEEKKLFVEYDLEKENNNIKKQEELLKQIIELKESKRQELEKATKSWDDKKANEIKKELRVFKYYR